MSNFEVAVSPHYRGRGWTDRATGIAFEPQNDSRLNTRTISKDMYEDLTGIKNSLRLNHLLLIKGNLDGVTAEKPTKVNPEELTGEELDKLLIEGSGDTSALDTEIKSLKETNAKLESEKSGLQSEKESLESANAQLELDKAELQRQLDELAPVEGASTYSVKSPETVDREAMKNDHTREALIAIAKDENVDIDSKDTKSDIVNKIADKREK